VSDDIEKELAEDPKFLSGVIARMAEDAVRMQKEFHAIRRYARAGQETEGGDARPQLASILIVVDRALQKGGNASD
jgi:hypothetical protein